MYEGYYGFKERPFALTPDPEYMFLAHHHREALTMIEYGLTQQAPIMLITGEVGCGKTTLIRFLLSRLDKSTSCGLIANVGRNFDNLLQWVCMAFGLEYRNRSDVELHDEFSQFLIREYAANRRVLLIVDEAQNLSPELLEDLRVLTNINADKHVVLQIVLVGQPELRTTVNSPAFRQLAQRISVDHHLEPMTAEETRWYVRHRLRVAGGEVSTFRSAAIDMIHEASRGVPRLVNQLCDAALVYGYSERSPRIDATIVQEVLKDKEEGGLLRAGRETRTIPTLGDA
jgi:type II secretory pathway predicted ATPase ExeA